MMNQNRASKNVTQTLRVQMQKRHASNNGTPPPTKCATMGNNKIENAKCNMLTHNDRGQYYRVPWAISNWGGRGAWNYTVQPANAACAN